METPTTAQLRAEAVPPSSSSLVEPVPLSFPAILRTPGVPAARYELRDTAYVRPSGSILGRAAKKEDVEGKRRTRRKENGV